MLVGWVALGIVVIAKTGPSYVGPGDFGRTVVLSIEGGFTLLGAGLLAFLDVGAATVDGHLGVRRQRMTTATRLIAA